MLLEVELAKLSLRCNNSVSAYKIKLINVLKNHL